MGPTQDMVKKSSEPLTVVEGLTSDQGIAGSSHTRGCVNEQSTLLLSIGSTKIDLVQHECQIVDRDLKSQNKQKKNKISTSHFKW